MWFHISAILHFRPNSGSEDFQGQEPLWEAEEDHELLPRPLHLCTSHKISSSWDLSADPQIKSPGFKEPPPDRLLVFRQAAMKKTGSFRAGGAHSLLRVCRCKDDGGKSEAGADQQRGWMRHYPAESWFQRNQRSSKPNCRLSPLVTPQVPVVMLWKSE